MLSEIHQIAELKRSRWAKHITNYMYLGNATHAQQLDKLKDAGITHILNVADDVPNSFPDSFIYCNLMVSDWGQDKGISRVFKQAEEFIRQAIAQGGEGGQAIAHGGARGQAIAHGGEGGQAIAQGGEGGQAGGRVLVHCAAGMNRSVTVVLAILMMVEQLPLQQSLLVMKEKQCKMAILKDNQMQLKEFEIGLFGKSSLISDEQFVQIMYA